MAAWVKMKTEGVGGKMKEEKGKKEKIGIKTHL